MQKVSIVTISFNQARYLEAAIESVLQQDHPSIEYIVVDPGSTDGSRDIIERYRGRIFKIVYEPDEGPADGLNRGFDSATGDIFGCLNADDVLLPGAVSSAVKELERPDLDVVCGDGYFIDGEGNIQRRCFSTNFSARRFALGGAVLMQQSSFWRSGWHRKVGGFNIRNRTSWDGEFFFQIALAGGKFRHVHEYWSCFRIHRQSITGSGLANAEYEADRQRMIGARFASYGRLLPLAQRAARAMKFIEDPRIVPLRLSERIFGPPKLRSPSKIA